MCMDGWMDGCIDGWMVCRADGLMKLWIDGAMNEWIYGLLGGHFGGLRVHGRMEVDRALQHVYGPVYDCSPKSAQ